VAELLVTISSEELLEWAAYYQLDPFGSYRSDLQTGIIVSQLLRPHQKKGATPLKPTDFMPDFSGTPAPPRMTPQEIHARLETLLKRRPHG